MTLRSMFTVAVILGSTTAGSAILAPAYAVPFQVSAFTNSSSGGTGLNTISLNAGDGFTVTVDPGDLWSAGALPRWSNADGLTGPLLATGSDDSGQPAGTQIGSDFGLYTQGNLTAPYGTLVGQIDSGDFFVIGTSFTGTAAVSGILKLFYWDENFGDNSQFVTADVTAGSTPLPAALPLFATGALGLLAFCRRRKAEA